MSQPYVLVKPYRQYHVGQVIEPGALLGDGLVRLSIAVKVGPKEVSEMAKIEPGALPYFAPEALQRLYDKRGLSTGTAPRAKVGKTSLVKR